MKIKKHLKSISFYILILLFSVTSTAAFGNNFSEEQAFTMIFGNYDRTHKSSVWKNMKFPNKEDIDSFFEKKTGIVSSLFLESYKEGGKDKFFFLTKTIPIGAPFDCHACLPLISATVFAWDRTEWKVESQNLFLMYKGEYGEPPGVKLITIGRDKVGLSLEFDGHGEVHTKELILLVPYKKSIYNSHQEAIYYDNFGVCGQSVPCASYTAKLNFNHSGVNTFYDLKIKRFGTENDGLLAKIVRINEETLLQFVHGKYVRVSRKIL